MKSSATQQQADALADLAHRYVELAAGLPHVRRVLYEPLISQITTLVETDPLQSAPRYAVFAAEQRAGEEHPGVLVNFRLINLSEAEEAERQEWLSQRAEILWTSTRC